MKKKTPISIKSDFIDFPEAKGEIYAMGLTYLDHIIETGQKADKPVVFRKHCGIDVMPSVVKTPTSSQLMNALANLSPNLSEDLKVKLHELPALLDYEVEIGILLLESVDRIKLRKSGWMPKMGYFIANDITSRSIQICGEVCSNHLDRMNFWSASKSFEGFLPVSQKVWCPSDPDENTYPDVSIELQVNGHIRQNAKVSNIIHTPKQILRYAVESSDTGVLHPGDIILTGTPAGVSFQISRLKQIIGKLLPKKFLIRKAIQSSSKQSNYLKSGDTVLMKADWLGSFEFTIE